MPSTEDSAQIATASVGVALLLAALGFLFLNYGIAFGFGIGALICFIGAHKFPALTNTHFRLPLAVESLPKRNLWQTFRLITYFSLGIAVVLSALSIGAFYIRDYVNRFPSISSAPSAQGFTGHQVDEKVAAATEPLNKRIAELTGDNRRDPLDSRDAKWAFAENLSGRVIRGDFPKCKVLIERYPTAFAAHATNNLEAVLRIMFWDFIPDFTTNIPAGISVEGLTQGNSRACADGFGHQFQLMNWKNHNPQISFIQQNSPDADKINTCGDCFIVNIGDDPTQ
jgi:hypothetical protein